MIVFGAAALAGAYFGASSSFVVWARRYETWQLGWLLALSIALAVFGFYHWRRTTRLQ